ncbi:hypothetical protein AB0G74_15685 [Streptomyces sp. NPDC020875]|uniref:hypothetical protein n=1 Tax=Streptomyces sp. NPDC020875 TaxID=3154898 RepID=UPI0033E12920
MTAVRQDGTDLETSAFSQGERVVALDHAERGPWGSATLTIAASLPEDELAEGPWTDVVAVAVLTESATNARTTTRLLPGAGGVRTGRLRLSRSDYRGRADLSVKVVATVGGVSGRVVACSDEDWIVDFTAPSPVRRRGLDINEVDFRDGPYEWLRSLKDSPWAVDTSGELPVVHVNTAFDGIAELLRPGGDDMERAVGELLSARIATDVWTAAFHAAVGATEVDSEGNPTWPGDWREDVLRGMLADVMPDRSEDDALREVHVRRSDPVAWSRLQTQINYAALRRAKVAKSLGRTVRVLESSQRESNS